MRRSALALASIVWLMFAGTALAQGTLEVVPGEVVEVPIVDQQIVIDGNLDDWVGVPEVVTVSGPLPSPDPAATGELRWRLLVQGESLHFASTITDEVIAAGFAPDEPWTEDSIELYVDFSGDPTLTSYADGVAQIRLSAENIGRTDPAELMVTGEGSDAFVVRGLVFETADGWGVEAQVAVGDAAALTDGSSFGVQVQANGSSGAGRDLKLSWSVADFDDVSFADPSVFGEARIVEGVVGDAATVDTVAVEGEASSSSVARAVEEQPSPAEDAVAVETVDQAEEGSDGGDAGSSILPIALFALVILVGGVLLQRFVAGRNVPPDQDIDPDDPDDIEELISSILD